MTDDFRPVEDDPVLTSEREAMLGDPSVPQASELALGNKKTCTTLTGAGVMWQTIIHCVFIASAVGIAWTDRLMSNGSGSHRERPGAAH